MCPPATLPCCAAAPRIVERSGEVHRDGTQREETRRSQLYTRCSHAAAVSVGAIGWKSILNLSGVVAQSCCNNAVETLPIGEGTPAQCPSKKCNEVKATMIDRPLRVCFMIDKLAPAGIELQLVLLIKWLDRSKVTPYLCLLDGTDEQTRKLEPDDCPVIRLGVRSLCRFSSVAAAVRLARFLRRERIDVLHPLFPDSLYFGTPVARAAGVPCIAGFCVDLGYWKKPRDRWLTRLLSKLVDGTVANCKACRQVAIAEERAAPDSVAIIPNGVDLSRFAALAEYNPSANEGKERRVGMIANLRPVKNVPLLIRAAGQLASNHPDVRFEIAGEGQLRGELESLIGELGLQDRVLLHGTVPDIPAFLAGLDVAVLCSNSEGAPNAIMEYMAAGRPIVVTDVGGNREMIEHDRHGLVILPDSVEHLSSAIDRLLRDRALAARLGAAARQRAFAEYGVEAQARRYEDFYLRCYVNKTAPKPPACSQT